VLHDCRHRPKRWTWVFRGDMTCICVLFIWSFFAL
jgi:hypothetical protein